MWQAELQAGTQPEGSLSTPTRWTVWEACCPQLAPTPWLPCNPPKASPASYWADSAHFSVHDLIGLWLWLCRPPIPQASVTPGSRSPPGLFLLLRCPFLPPSPQTLVGLCPILCSFSSASSSSAQVSHTPPRLPTPGVGAAQSEPRRGLRPALQAQVPTGHAYLGP